MTRILVVDDCEEMRDVVEALLNDEGFEVCKAECSSEALDLLSRSDFDLVLCDLVLPVDTNDASPDTEEGYDSAMVGVHCIHQITKRYPKIPVIAISGELVGNPLSMVEQFGARATLSKPFRRNELLEVVNGALMQ